MKRCFESIATAVFRYIAAEWEYAFSLIRPLEFVS